MKHIYVVTVQAEYTLPRVSGEAYTTLLGAQNFIEHREDAPKKVSDFKYIGRRQEYLIHELVLR